MIIKALVEIKVPDDLTRYFMNDITHEVEKGIYRGVAQECSPREATVQGISWDLGEEWNQRISEMEAVEEVKEEETE